MHNDSEQNKTYPSAPNPETPAKPVWDTPVMEDTLQPQQKQRTEDSPLPRKAPEAQPQSPVHTEAVQPVRSGYRVVTEQPVQGPSYQPPFQHQGPVCQPVPPQSHIPPIPPAQVHAETVAHQPEFPRSVLPEAPVAADAPKKEKKSGIGLGLVITIALCCSLVGGVLGALVTGLSGKNSGTKVSEAGNDPSLPTETTSVIHGKRPVTIIDINEVDTSKLMTPAEVYATNVNSAVGITTSVTTNYWGYQTTSAAAGSGLIYSEDGYILTNYHVIENSTSITVTFFDNTSLPAKLVGYDINNDIAILKVEATGLTPVKQGDSDNMNVGDQVIAIGNPLGELTFSLTSGVISALDREVTTSTGVTMNLIQTDCAINSGNSGGPLFNLYGELIGITNAKYSGNSASGASIDNIGFAIPLNNVQGIVDSIIEKGYISKPYIGVSVVNVSEETQSYGLPQGAAVKEIVPDSPAQAAGLRVNDIITHADGQRIADRSELVAIVGDKAVGDKLKLTVHRQTANGSQTLDITVTIGENKQDALAAPSTGSQQNPSGGTNPFEGFFGNFG